MFSGPSLLPEQKQSRTGGLGRRVAEGLATPLVAARTFHLKQHDKEDAERAGRVRSAQPSTTATPVVVVQPGSPLADALENALAIAKKASDAAHYLRNGLSVDLGLIDSLKQLGSFENSFADTVASLRDAKAALTRLKLPAEEDLTPEETDKMNRTFAKAHRVVKTELLQTKKLIAEIEQSVASLKKELTQPEFNVVEEHPEVFSPDAQPFDTQKAGDLLLNRQRICAGRALESATHIRRAPSDEEAAKFLSDYVAFVAAAKGVQKQLEVLQSKSMDLVLAERMETSKKVIDGTLQSAKAVVASHMSSARTPHVAGTTTNRNAPVEDK
jgi:hypothetical protein